MFKKTGQIIFFILFFSGVAIAQSSFVAPLPAPFGQVNLVVVALVFTLFFYDFRSALYAALIMGFWRDLYAFCFFGFHPLLLFLTALISYRILKTWLTNRSLYSFLLLLAIASASYAFMSALLSYVSGTSILRFFLWRGSFWAELFYQAVWSVVIGILAFSLAGALTRRFKPFFLERG